MKKNTCTTCVFFRENKIKETGGLCWDTLDKVKHHHTCKNHTKVHELQNKIQEKVNAIIERSGK